MNGTTYERFWSKVDCSGGCWLWTAATGQGYGRFGNWDDKARTQLAHRVAYEMIVGPIAEGMTVDHLCRNRRCVNPDHVEIVMAGANALRGYGPAALNVRKTHCVAGHEFTPESTYFYKGRRECRPCRREAFLAFKHRQADSAQAP